MAVHPGPFPVQLIPGIRQDLAPELAPVGTLAEAVNVRYGKGGAIFCRPGMSSVTSNTQGTLHEFNGASGIGPIGSLGDLAIVGADGDLFALDETSDVWNFAGRYSTCVPVGKRRGLVTEEGDGFGKTKYGIAVSNTGFIITCACSSISTGVDAGLFVSIETPNGTRIAYERQAGRRKCQAVSVGSTMIVIAENSDNGTLYGEAFTVANGAVSSTGPVSLGALNSNSQYWDTTASNTHLYLAHQSASGTVTIARFDATLAAVSNTTQSVTGNAPLSIYASGQDLWLGWVDDPGNNASIRARAIELDLSAFRSTSTAVMSPGGTDIWGPPLFGPNPDGTSEQVYVVFGHLPTSAVRSTYFQRATSPGNSANAVTFGAVTPRRVPNVVPLSKPDTEYRVWCLTQPEETSGYDFLRSVLLRFPTDLVNDSSYLTPLVELAGKEFVRASVAPALPTPDYFHAVASSSGTHRFMLPFVLRQDESANLFGLDCLEYQDYTAYPHRTVVDLGDSCVVSGQPTEFFGQPAGMSITNGLLSDFYRVGGAEVGFAQRPKITSLVASNTGSLTANSNYAYVVVDEWTDMAGRLHRSAPSAPATITLSNSNAGVTVLSSSMSVGQRINVRTQMEPRRHVYRTVANGTTYWRLTPAIGAPGAVEATSGECEFVDGVADATIEGRNQVYTDGGPRPYKLAPSCRFMWADERRVWAGGLWEKNQVHGSLDRIPGQPLEFADDDSYRRLLPKDATGGAYQDGTNYVFSHSSIYAFTGDGPERDGVGQFGQPRLLTDEAGCIDCRSVLVTSAGIMFQSSRGLELLPRGGGRPVFVGAAVQDLVRSYPYCRGAALHSDGYSRTARFLMAAQPDGQTVTDSRVFLYDLDIAARDPFAGWSVDYALSTGYPVVAIGRWPSGTFVAQRDLPLDVPSNAARIGLLDSYTSRVSLDAGATYTTRIKTNHIRPFGPAGYGRLQHVTVLYSNPTGPDVLTMTVYTDGQDRSRNWTLSSSTRSHYRRVTPGASNQSQQCSSVEILLELTRPVPNGSIGPAFHAVQLDLKPEGGRPMNNGEE